MPPQYIIGGDEVGRAAEGAASPSLAQGREPRPPKYIVGIDEVGRGSLAGPVMVAVVCLPAGRRIANPLLGDLRDSKKLTPLRREAWFGYLAAHPDIRYEIARVHPRMIEKINISGAANLAAWRAFRRLSAKVGFGPGDCNIYLDGGLYLLRKGFISSARTLAKADESIPVVAIASILAKVTRDRSMLRLARKYPGYGLERHKGYATRSHREAIQASGPEGIHRLTFLKNYRNLGGNTGPVAAPNQIEPI